MKEKQIDEIFMEMAYDILEDYTRAYSEVDKECLAEYIRKKFDEYNAGYRKQSEGEWIVCGMFDDFFKCSSCGDKHPLQTAIEYKYCPNCGAKMKGGEQE